MHELSLVRSLLRQVERLRRQHGGIAVETIEVEIGPLSGVEPLLVREAFDALVVEESLAGAELVIHNVPLTARCLNCCADFELTEFDFCCTSCESRSIKITGGDEFRLLTVSLQSDLEAEETAKQISGKSAGART